MNRYREKGLNGKREWIPSRATSLIWSEYRGEIGREREWTTESGKGTESNNEIKRNSNFIERLSTKFRVKKEAEIRVIGQRVTVKIK